MKIPSHDGAVTYDVLSNHATGKYPASARVRLYSVLLADVTGNHADMLRWIRTRPLSVERKEFVAQLTANNVSVADQQVILALPQGSKAKIVKHYECGK